MLLGTFALRSKCPFGVQDNIRLASLLRHIGFRPIRHKKGAYVDGHERADVVASRSQYLKELNEVQASHLPPPPCSDEKAATAPPDAEARKTLVSVFHDESIFNTNEGQTWMWAAEGQPIIQPKTRGSGIMISKITWLSSFIPCGCHICVRNTTQRKFLRIVICI